MKKYKISIIVPVYNNEEHIDQCLNSIVNQDIGIDNLQVILINDGSTDNSLNILNKYSKPNILVINKKNTGVSDTRNIGMSKALGKYILFLDSDDYLSLNACRDLYSFFESHYDEVDLVTYPIIYDTDGKFRKHFRYASVYENGTGIYDLSSNYNIIQTTINIMIKNNYSDNPLFEVKQNFSEDERFDTEILMKKQSIGFCENAIYYYRRHVGTANDTIINPLYTFDTIMNYYEYLFKKYKKDGKVAKYIQSLYLNNIGWRIKKGALWPTYLTGDKYNKAIERIRKLVNEIDVDVIENSNNINFYHKIFLLNFSGRNIKMKKNNDKYIVLCDDFIIDDFKSIHGIISRLKIDNNNIKIMASMLNPMFDIYKPKLFVEKVIDNKKITEEVQIFESNKSYHLSNFKTTKSYGFDISINLNNLSNFKFYIKLDKYNIPVEFSFDKFASNNFIESNKNIIYVKNEFLFNIQNSSIITTIKSRLTNFKRVLVTRPKACLYRIIYYLIGRKNIWLYNDNVNNINNSYYQFLHDIEKKDGINRYYVYKFSDKKINKYFDHKYKKNLIKWGSLKHKIYYLKAKYIFTSYSEVKAYCPFNNAIKYYNDLSRYKLIYLQHGILHEELIKSYAKEFTEIDKFLISTNFEKHNLVNKYHYKEEDLLPFGMNRFSNKKSIKQENKNKRILFAPLWRGYLISNNKKHLKEKEFLNSSYYKKIFEFLHSSELKKILKDTGYILDFRLHPFFKDYARFFKIENLENITLVNENNIVVTDYMLIITDFSSIQFDFVNLRKPILYFLPDKLEIEAGLHIYKKLDLEYKDSYGDLCLTSKELLKKLKIIIDKNFEINKKYLKRMDKCFLDINDPCEEIYNNIIKD